MYDNLQNLSKQMHTYQNYLYVKSTLPGLISTANRCISDPTIDPNEKVVSAEFLYNTSLFCNNIEDVKNYGSILVGVYSELYPSKTLDIDFCLKLATFFNNEGLYEYSQHFANRGKELSILKPENSDQLQLNALRSLATIHMENQNFESVLAVMDECKDIIDKSQEFTVDAKNEKRQSVDEFITRVQQYKLDRIVDIKKKIGYLEIEEDGCNRRE